VEEKEIEYVPATLESMGPNMRQFHEVLSADISTWSKPVTGADRHLRPAIALDPSTSQINAGHMLMFDVITASARRPPSGGLAGVIVLDFKLCSQTWMATTCNAQRVSLS
jgi:hypothetical protein